MLLATPLRARPDDLGSVVLLPYQMRAVQVAVAPAGRRWQRRRRLGRRHAGERLEELRLAALPAVVERDARQVVVLQHVQRHALHKGTSKFRPGLQKPALDHVSFRISEVV